MIVSTVRKRNALELFKEGFCLMVWREVTKLHDGLGAFCGIELIDF
jgi:hypothetical protein